MKITKILAFGFAHYILYLFMFVSYFGMSMGRFDNGEPATIVERVLGVLTSIMRLPLVSIISMIIRPSGIILEHLPFLLNSLLWGVAINWLLSLRANKKALK
jgi:hypothetical protein